MTMGAPITIPFSELWTKLVCRAIGDEFHTARWIDKMDYYSSNIEKECVVTINNKTLYKCVITGVVEAVLGEITDSFIHEDTYIEYSRKKFYDILYNWYHRKPEWAGWNSKLCIVFLKITEHLQESPRIDECPKCKTITGVQRGGPLLAVVFNDARTFECSKCGQMWIIGSEDAMKGLTNAVIYGDKKGRTGSGGT
jgi:DNA-directed RNA polymerase subunit M/transcription elongation factor TFIIS